MRLYLLSGLLVALSLYLASISPDTAFAKTTLELDPNSGPGGSMVRVVGSGFCEGQVALDVALSNPVDPGASAGTIVDDASQLPKSMHLASIPASRGGFETAVSIPTQDEVTAFFGERPEVVYVLAIAPMDEGCSYPGQTFAIGEAYTFTQTALPSAGSGGGSTPMDGTRWAAAALALFCGALLCIGCLRLSR
jgi:hypothetical protein